MYNPNAAGSSFDMVCTKCRKPGNPMLILSGLYYHYGCASYLTSQMKSNCPSPHSPTVERGTTMRPKSFTTAEIREHVAWLRDNPFNSALHERSAAALEYLLQFVESEEIAKSVCHDDQLAVWDDEFSFSISPWLKDFESYDDKVAFGMVVKDEIKRIVATAFDLAAASELYDSLFEILNYSGGADSALDDDHVMDRAMNALAKACGKPVAEIERLDRASQAKGGE